jgi:hypothetical protein
MLSETNRNGGRLFSSLRAVLSSLRAPAADSTWALSELHHKRWATWDGARSGCTSSRKPAMRRSVQRKNAPDIGGHATRESVLVSLIGVQLIEHSSPRQLAAREKFA